MPAIGIFLSDQDANVTPMKRIMADLYRACKLESTCQMYTGLLAVLNSMQYMAHTVQPPGKAFLGNSMFICE